jgi:hypothetical protein
MMVKDYMQRSRYGFKLFLILYIVQAILISCNDSDRDNVLDPKNPESYRAQVISLEAFVNTENDQLFNEYMLQALETINDRYPGKTILMQYHRNATGFPDSLTIAENENLYEHYINKFDNLKGVPDVFINGVTVRIKGASSTETAIDRIDAAIQSQLIENSFFTIEPTVMLNNSKIFISTKIARLGSDSISDIIVRATITEQIDSDFYTRVVRHMENSNLIPRLQPGEQKEIKFSDVVIDPETNLQVVFTVTSNQGMIIHQTAEVIVP